jgi:hypothetical protein
MAYRAKFTKGSQCLYAEAAQSPPSSGPLTLWSCSGPGAASEPADGGPDSCSAGSAGDLVRRGPPGSGLGAGWLSCVENKCVHNCLVKVWQG